MPNYNREYILTFISQLIHPKIAAATLSHYFPAKQLFWDRLLQIGSGHLVLPAIYAALKRKKLVEHAPKDLMSYLAEISDLNLKRNTAISKQIAFLAELFNKHQIEYVFLKGAAMLISKPYDALSERMVGDIDVLVAAKDLLRAQQLLLNKGFKAVSKPFRFSKALIKIKDKHLDRLIHPNYTAAIELHRHLLNDHNALIRAKKVLENKLQTKAGYWIPSKQHLWQHAILNWQYNDYGMALNNLAYRTVVDVLYLEPKNIAEALRAAPKAIKHFYSLLSLYYEQYPVYFLLNKLFYKWQLKSRTFYKLYSFYYRLLSFIPFTLSRIPLFFCSKTYRKRVLGNPRLFVQRIFDVWNK